MLEDVFGGLTHIGSEVEFDVGVLAQGSVGGLGAEDVVTVFNTSFPGPTACLSFDRGKGTLGPVTTVAAATTAAGKGGKGGPSPSGKSAAEQMEVGRMGVLAGMLLGVCACFVSL